MGYLCWTLFLKCEARDWNFPFWSKSHLNCTSGPQLSLHDVMQVNDVMHQTVSDFQLPSPSPYLRTVTGTTRSSTGGRSAKEAPDYHAEETPTLSRER